MDTNEIMTNGNVVEMAEELVTTGPSGGVIMAVIFGAGVLGGIFASKYVVAPIMAKLKARKDQNQEPKAIN